MTSQEAISDLDASLAADGEDVQLQRAGGQTAATLACRAFVRGFKPAELAGGIIQGDRLVIISNSEIAAQAWPGPPKKPDSVVIAGRVTTIQGVETIRLGAVAVRHNIQVRG
ncbi:MAG: hypothetical protein P4M09_22530 [Devosia sp.]|nr:hypothetical protein [Devosia sp.]